ncbi:hypothetical protein P8452_05450 [Trifolium repens]|nr:hypothetical protein P8452_05450 [Trifolium repens]
MEEDVVIVGAGIAGLTTALGLHRLGVKSLVLESWDSLRVTGFGLAIWENAWKALDALGVGDILRHRHIHISGNVTTSFRDKGKLKQYCVRRKLLLEGLANELPSGTIRYLSKVVALEESDFSKVVHLADGTTIKTKVLIGCDGVNSMVAKWLGFKEATYTGRYGIRGCAELENNHNFEPVHMRFFGNGFRALVVPCDEKTVYWYFTWTSTIQDKELIEKNPAELKQYVLNKLEKMPSDVKYFIEKTELHAFQLASFRYRHPWELIMRNISKGNVCVAGDAFHPMTPDIGQGGCCALEDGVVLARCLSEAFSKKPMEEEEQYKRIEEGLKKYANERRWRCIDLITTSYIIGFILLFSRVIQN